MSDSYCDGGARCHMAPSEIELRDSTDTHSRRGEVLAHGRPRYWHGTEVELGVQLGGSSAPLMGHCCGRDYASGRMRQSSVSVGQNVLGEGCLCGQYVA